MWICWVHALTCAAGAAEGRAREEGEEVMANRGSVKGPNTKERRRQRKESAQMAICAELDSLSELDALDVARHVYERFVLEKGHT